MRTLLGATFDAYINLRFAIAELFRSIGYAVDDALDVWGDDE